MLTRRTRPTAGSPTRGRARPPPSRDQSPGGRAEARRHHQRVEPHLACRVLEAQRVVRIRHDEHAHVGARRFGGVRRPVAQFDRCRQQFFPCVGTGVDDGDGVVGNAERRQVAVAGEAFGETITFLLGSGGDQQGGEALPVELERAIEAGLQHRRGAPVVLRGAHHHDRLGLVTMDLPGGVPYLDEGGRDVQRAEGEQDEGGSADDAPRDAKSAYARVVAT